MSSKHLSRGTSKLLVTRRPINGRLYRRLQKNARLQRVNNPHKEEESCKMPSPAKDKIRLYSNRFCPYAQRIHLVLDAKKLQYETVFINLARKPDWFVQRSRHGKVPALEVENGDVLNESVIIANYIDEKYPQNTLHPKDVLQKAKDQLLIDQFNTIINCMNTVIKSAGRCLDDYEDIIKDGLNSFEEELGIRGHYFGGHRPGMVDYMIWPWVERSDLLKVYGNRLSIKKDKYKRLLEWKELMTEDKAVKKSFQSTDSHIKFLQSHRAGIPDYDIC